MHLEVRSSHNQTRHEYLMKLGVNISIFFRNEVEVQQTYINIGSSLPFKFKAKFSPSYLKHIFLRWADVDLTSHTFLELSLPLFPLKVKKKYWSFQQILSFNIWKNLVVERLKTICQDQMMRKLWKKTPGK